MLMAVYAVYLAAVLQGRAANPDDFATVGAMTRKFDAWLHELQHSERAEVGSA